MKNLFALLTMICCFLSVSCNNNTKEIDKEIENWKQNDFFGLNLDEKNQVSEFHALLENGRLSFRKNKLTEWADFLGSDYILTEGKISTTQLFEGTSADALGLFHYLDNIFFSRYNNRQPFKQREWIQDDDESYYMIYVNFYDYGNYRIGLTLCLESKCQDEKECQHASIRLGLGQKLEHK